MFPDALRIRKEAIADAADSDEMLGVGGIVFDIASKANDEVVDGASVCVLVDSPDIFENVFAGDDVAFALGEVAEEICLHEGEVGCAVGGDQLESVESNSAVIEGVFVGLIGEGWRRGFRGGGALPRGAAEE